MRLQNGAGSKRCRLKAYHHEPPPGGDGEVKQLTRGPQSLQSVHGAQTEYSPPLPPSSQSPSEAKVHVFTTTGTRFERRGRERRPCSGPPTDTDPLPNAFNSSTAQATGT